MLQTQYEWKYYQSINKHLFSKAEHLIVNIYIRAGQIFEIFKCFKCFKKYLKNVSNPGNI